MAVENAFAIHRKPFYVILNEKLILVFAKTTPRPVKTDIVTLIVVLVIITQLLELSPKQHLPSGH